MTRRLSVRARTTLVAVVAVVPVLSAVGLAGVLLQQRQVEDAVTLVAEEQARSVAREVDARGTSGTIPPVLGQEEALVQVVDVTGAVLEASPELAAAAALIGPPTAGSRTTTLSGSVLGESEDYVVVAVPTASGGYVVAARSLETADVVTESGTGLLLVGIPVVAGLIGVVCWVLAGRALRPVEDLRVTASEITATGAGARLPSPGTGDEIDRLADTLNAMLERLDVAARSQRQFVADASHELRSPVAAIRTVMEVAPPGPAAWEEARRDVLSEAVRLGRLVDGLLLLARQDAGPSTSRGYTRVSLAEVVADEIARPRRLPVVCHQVGEAWVLGNRRALGAAVGNLLDNAERHARSVVTVEVGLDAGQVFVRVTDDGNGIPPHQREQVFERFVRLDEARSRDEGGAGLGLSIVRSIAQDHGGSVAVDGPRDQHHDDGASITLRIAVATDG